MKLLLLTLALVSCRAVVTPPGSLPAMTDGRSEGAVEANWKERLAQRYVYLEHSGDYRLLGPTLQRLADEAQAQGMTPDGAPFALLFDDPGRVPVSALRARACLPVRGEPSALGSLRYDELPRAMVVYARVPGRHVDAVRSYPALFSYLERLGWTPGGPVREIYFVEPGTIAPRTLTEVQIPWSGRSGPE